MFRKLLPLLAGICLSLVTYSAYAQSAQVSLSMQDASLEQVMKEVERQTGYLLVYHENIDLQQVADIAEGPDKARHAMAVVAAMMFYRYNAGAAPMALVSMDNCSHNGEKLKSSVLEIARAWMLLNWLKIITLVIMTIN